MLALIDATAILVIVAATVALVATARIHHYNDDRGRAVENRSAAARGAGQSPVTAEVRTVGNSLREIKAGEHPALQSEIAQLKESLTSLKVSIDRLGSARSIILTDEAIGQLGRTVTDALIRFRDCSFSTRQTALQRTFRDKMVDAGEIGQPSAPP
ncbi:MAG: hypothetical protein E6G82_08100 [Alphaproteobacteria bacterium]|nr:MAG: hypothetical protein E6G82_08100 [Alphaproteobacteria bacterium]